MRTPSLRLRMSFVLVGLALLAAPAANAAEVGDPGCGTLRVTMRSNTVVYRLARTFIRAGSDSITWGGSGWQRGRDYVLDAMRGELRLLRQPIAGDTLLVRACWLLDPPPEGSGTTSWVSAWAPTTRPCSTGLGSCRWAATSP